MKRTFSLVLCTLLLFFSCLTASAADDEPPYEAIGSSDADSDVTATGSAADLSPVGVDAVPMIEIHTENGNGALLLKSDGYVNAAVTITDPDGNVLSDAIQLKVRGNSTAIDSISKKGFNFRFEKKKNVLGMGRGKKWALLANCFDPTLLRNYLVFDCAEKLGLPYVSQQRIAELWLDGVYRGCYTVYEPVQEGSDRVDIDIESNNGKKDFLLEYESSRVEDGKTYLKYDGQRFAFAEPEEPEDEQISYVTGVMTDLINTLKSGSEEDVRQAIDTDSFAKYYLLNEFAKTADFGLSSVFFFYKDSKLYAGPPWDYDLSLGNLNADLNSTSAKEAAKSDGLLQSSKNLYRYLCNKTWFIDEVKHTYAAYYDVFEKISADSGTLDTMRAAYQSVFDRNFSVWRVNRWWLNYQKVPYATYEENYGFLKNWCAERNAWLTGYYGLQRYRFLLGDADGNGEVESIDSTLIQRCLALILEDADGMMSTRAALSGDTLDITDVTTIQRWLVGIQVPYPIGEEQSAMVVS